MQSVSYLIKKKIQMGVGLVSEQPKESALHCPEIHHKHLQVPKKPIKFGQSSGPLAGKTMGYGLGVMIVNCLNDEMEWEEKCKDAG
jgi:hypothetical protein